MVRLKQNSQKGQATTEAVLIMVAFLGLALLVSNQFKERELFANFISGPWQSLNSMIQHGSWETGNAGQADYPLNYGVSIDTEEESI